MDQHSQTWPLFKPGISQLVKVRMTLSHFWVKACSLILHPWKLGCPLLLALGAAALQKWSLLERARINCLEIWPMSYNCWKHLAGLSLDLGPNEHIYNVNESLFKPRKHPNISATLYLVDSALCNVLCIALFWSACQCSAVQCSAVQFIAFEWCAASL